MNKCAKAVMIAGGICAVAELSFTLGKAWGLSALNMRWPNTYNELTEIMAKATEDPSIGVVQYHMSASARVRTVFLLNTTKLFAMGKK